MNLGAPGRFLGTRSASIPGANLGVWKRNSSHTPVLPQSISVPVPVLSSYRGSSTMWTLRAQSFNQFLQDWVKRHPSHGLKIMASRDKCVSMITPLRGFSLLLPRRGLLRKNRTAAKKKVCGKVRLLPHGFGLGVPHNHVLNCTSSIPYAPVFKNVVYLTAMDVTCPLNSFHTFWT